MEYWMWFVFTIIAAAILRTLDAMVGLEGTPWWFGFGAPRNGLFGSIFSLATFLPSLAVSVRRLHDTDRSGWWILLPIAPVALALAAVFSADRSAGASVMIFAGVALLGVLICGLLLLVWYCTEGTRGPNRFGDDPKADIPADLARTFE
jgi:uncharacterized membrane protein YhaH (DUF805 family)